MSDQEQVSVPVASTPTATVAAQPPRPVAPMVKKTFEVSMIPDDQVMTMTDIEFNQLVLRKLMIEIELESEKYHLRLIMAAREKYTLDQQFQSEKEAILADFKKRLEEKNKSFEEEKDKQLKLLRDDKARIEPVLRQRIEAEMREKMGMGYQPSFAEPPRKKRGLLDKLLSGN